MKVVLATLVNIIACLHLLPIFFKFSIMLLWSQEAELCLEWRWLGEEDTDPSGAVDWDSRSPLVREVFSGQVGIQSQIFLDNQILMPWIIRQSFCRWRLLAEVNLLLQEHIRWQIESYLKKQCRRMIFASICCEVKFLSKSFWLVNRVFHYF